MFVFVLGCFHTANGQINYSFPGMQAQTAPIPTTSGTNNYPKAGDTAVTSNQAFINDYVGGSTLMDSTFIKNIVTFRINEAIPRILSKPFTAVLTYKVFFTGKNGATYDSVRSNLTLTINYDTAKASTFNTSNSLVFYNGYKVKVQVLSISTSDTSLLKALEVDNTIVYHNYYKFDCSTSSVNSLTKTNPTGSGTPDELQVNWTSVTGVSGYDLEWTYIDSSAIQSNKYDTLYSQTFYKNIFLNNTTRVNLTDTFTRYYIPLLFEKQGLLFVRIRSFQNVPNGRRMESNWGTQIVNFGFSGHQTNMNWQSSTSFAEEGKRKSVVQYYDGSLRNRQTVTKDNTTRTTIVAEKMYDYQGRETIQVLPAPTLNTVIQYTANFNSINSGEYDKTHFDRNLSSYVCGSGADSMSNNSGSSLYYSPSNPDKNNSYNQFIPNALDYPFSETKYLSDNTGRIASQGGVGKMHQIGGGHETKYYYGTPDQSELDALFGTEVGLASHYFKNYVRDANGQYSVSYIDMHGRTIATALAGNLPDSVKLDYLTNKKDSVLTKTLTDSTNNIVKGYSSESSRAFVLTRADNVLFTYNLPAANLVINDCNNNPVTYSCLYDLTITITDRCGNQTFGGQPYVYTQTNIPSATSVTISKSLPEGEYTVTKTLTINQASFEYYRDSVFLKNNLCKTVANFTSSYIDSFKTLHSGCTIQDCNSCLTALGTYTAFRTNLITQNGWNPASITTSQETFMSTEYAKQQSNCAALCPKDINRLDEIYSEMLQDVNPYGGQYADTTNIDESSIFYQAKYQTSTLHYLNAYGIPDTVTINGLKYIPNQLSKTNFVAYFNYSWANTLVQIHPEYSRLIFADTNITRASFDWDNDFNGTATFLSAKAKGYLNPTGNSAFTNKYANISFPIVTPSVRDSFFIRNPAQLTNMNNKMASYSLFTGRDTTAIWGIASETGYCSSDTSTSCIKTNKITPFPDTSSCIGSANVAWKNFANLYESYKNQLINSWIVSQRPVTASLTTAFASGTHFSRFTSDATTMANNSIAGLNAGDTSASGRAATQNTISNFTRIQYDSACRRYSAIWWSQLSPCQTVKFIRDGDSANLMNNLITVCRKGSDANHPYGSSSISPDSSYSFANFDTVLNYYIGRYNTLHPDSAISSQSCNAALILYPRTYQSSKPAVNLEIYGLPDTATCNRVSSLYNSYQSTNGAYTSFSAYLAAVYNTQITDSVLNLLLSRCSLPSNSCAHLSSPIILPPALQGGANGYCVGCNTIRSYNNLFTAKYPGKVPTSTYNSADTVQTAINQLYENFMNAQTGFAKHTSDYLTFLLSCNAYSLPSSDSLNTVVNLFNNNFNNYGKHLDANGCDSSTWIIDYGGQTNNTPYSHASCFSNGLMQFPDSLNKNGVPNGVDFDFVAHDSACVNGQFSLEFRIKDSLPPTQFHEMTMEVWVNSNPITSTFVRKKYYISFNNQDTNWCGLSYIDYEFAANNLGIQSTTLKQDYNSWRTVKFTFSNNLVYYYMDGVLKNTFTLPSGVSPQRFYGFGIAFGSSSGTPQKAAAFDWIKGYDQNGAVFYDEEFNDCGNFSLFSPAIECPKADCKSYFTSTYNTYMGKSYSFATIDSIYLAVTGQHPPVCSVMDTCSNFQFQKTYGGAYSDQFTDIRQTVDGGYISAGYTSSFGSGGNDAYLVKTDRKGNISWSKTYGGSAADNFQKVVQTSDSGYIAVGTTKSFHQSSGEIFVVKTDKNGKVQWSNGLAQGTTSGEIGYDIVQTPADSGYALVGLYNNGPGAADWEVIKLNKSGAISWAKRLGTAKTEKVGGILVDNDTLVIAGSTYSTAVGDPATNNDVVLFKLSRSSGTLIWTKSYDLESASNLVTGLTKTATGYKANVLDGSDTTATSGSNVVLDLDGNGGVRWTKKFPVPSGGTVGFGTGYPTTDKGYVFAQGETNSNANIYLHKMDSSGNIVWSNRIKRSGNQELFKIIQNLDSSFAAVGFDSTKALLIKTDKTGKTSCYDTAYSYSSTSVTTTPYTVSLTINSSLTFSSPGITVIAQTALPNSIVVCNSDACPAPTNLSGLTMCNSANSVYMPQSIIVASPAPCTDSTTWATSRATNVYNYYSDSVKGSFQNAYLGLCLRNTKLESFTLKDTISEYQYTLYYYDQAGNLVKTVPPAGVVQNFSTTWLSQVKTARAAGTLLAPAHTLVTTYTYNTLNLTVAQNTPDAGLSNFWYDGLGRLVLSQNAKQLAEGTNYSYTLYDALGRITEVGQINTGVGSVTTNTTKVPATWATWLGNNATNRYQVTNTVYDVAGPAGIAPWLVQNASTLRNRVSYSTITPGQKGSSLVYGSYYNYDIAGNVSSLLQDYGATSPMGTAGQEYKRIDYNYDLISGKVNSVGYQLGKSDAFMHFYQYDAENRIVDVYTSADSVTVEHEAHYVYYKHGPLARVLIGNNQVQGVDYAYTLQGWLKAVNGTTLNPANDMGQDGNTSNSAQQYIGQDAYGYSLQYYEGDYYPIVGGLFLTGAKAALNTNYKGLYNGNISSMAVNIGILNNSKLYNYKYDQLNRITAMDVFNGTNSGLNLWSGTFTSTLDYQERAAYDPNGNIKTYTRNGYGSTQSMDNLTYNYTSGTNKLSYISDAVASGNYSTDIDNQSSGNYTYDAAGNLITDQQAGITSNMTWSVYGKLLSISSKNLTYQYDATGNRVGKTSGTTNTWYVRDAQGNVMSVYSGTGSTMSLQEQELYGSSRLGMINSATAITGTAQYLDNLGSGTIYTFTRGKKLFELSNHLGNVLATISDKKFGSPVSGAPNQAYYYTADVKTAQDYYPFGMQMPGRTYTTSSAYRFGFNGKEKSDEINGGSVDYDYGARIYDSRAGKFFSVDPLTKSYPWYSPYHFAGNKPIFAKDLDGTEDTPFDFSEADRKIREESARLYKIDPALSRQFELRGNLIGFSFVGGALLLPWDLSTGGNVTRAVITLATASQVAGAFEHNVAKTPEGKSDQIIRSKELLTGAFITWGSGELIGTGINITSQVAKLAINRFYFAKTFYQEAGFSEEEFISHASGIDLTQKVFKQSYAKGTVLEQWSNLGKDGKPIQGNYYTLPGTDPNSLGIDMGGRVKTLVTLEEETTFLQSTAGDVHKGGKTLKGGGVQLFQTGVKAKVKVVQTTP